MPPTTHHDLHAEITNDIIAAIEAGVDEFVMPWHGADAIGLPKNALTDGYYHGINLLVLMMRARRAGYGEPIWATYRQWQELGRQVSKGQRGTRTILYKPMKAREDDNHGDQKHDRPDDDHEDDDGRPRVYIRTSYLFNVAQTDGDQTDGDQTDGCRASVEPDMAPADQISPVARAEALIAASGATIIEGEAKAQYEVRTDRIIMPDRCRFDGRSIGDPTAAWYNCIFHELTHWCGAGHRLDRPVGSGQLAPYAFEELVAEIGSAFMMAALGIPNMPVEAYAGHVANWLQTLRNDKRFIFKAAAEAGRVAEYLLAFEAAEMGAGTDETAAAMALTG